MVSAKFDLREWIRNWTRGVNTENTVRYSCWWDLLWVDSVRLPDGPITKRKLLSVTQSIFDPLRFTSPRTLIPKLLLQESWKLNIRWDTELPNEVMTTFWSWMTDLPWLNKCRIKRRLEEMTIQPESVRMLTFSDASKSSYACISTGCQWGKCISAFSAAYNNSGASKRVLHSAAEIDGGPYCIETIWPCKEDDKFAKL